MKVELGAGARALEGWTRVDVNPRYADVVADALSLPFGDGTVEAMRAVDVLEHLSWRDTHQALSEWARVLRQDGELFVQVPDAGQIMTQFVQRPRTLASIADVAGQPVEVPPIIGCAWRLLGGHQDGRYVEAGDDWRWNAHYALFDRAWLTDCLMDAGFVIVSLQTNGHPNLLCRARKQ